MKRLVFVSISTTCHVRKLANLEHEIQKTFSRDAAHIHVIGLHLNILGTAVTSQP